MRGSNVTRAMSLLMAGAVIVVAGCGGSSSSSGSSSPASSTAASPPSTATTAAAPASTAGGHAVHLSAVPGKLAFDAKSLEAKAGAVTVSMANPSSFPHGISVQGHGIDVDGKVVQQGGTSTITAKLKPGTYVFYCPVPGHRQAGMQGTLTVT